MQTLSVMKPKVGQYVRCLANPLKESVTIGRFYKVQEGRKILDDKGREIYTLAKFEPFCEKTLEIFK